MSESSTETTERADLSWLSEVQPTVTKMRTSKRGRQPGKNPVAGHVAKSYRDKSTLTLPVPAQHARQTERMLRRAALRESWSISIQVLTADPALDTTTSDNVVALKDIGTLAEGADVWVSFSVTDKEDDTQSAEVPGSGTDSADNADPFAGQPEMPQSPTEPVTASEPEDKPRKGRRSGRAA